MNRWDFVVIGIFEDRESLNCKMNSYSNILELTTVNFCSLKYMWYALYFFRATVVVRVTEDNMNDSIIYSNQNLEIYYLS